MADIVGPRPGRPGHLADHAAIAERLAALDIPRLQVTAHLPERVTLNAGWVHGYAPTLGAHPGLYVARVGQAVIVAGMISATQAHAANTPIATLPVWAWPTTGQHILAPQGVRWEVSTSGVLSRLDAWISANWGSLAHTFVTESD